LASVLLVGVLAALGNVYAQVTQPLPPGASRPPLNLRRGLIPFVCLKMLLDGLVYYLWIAWLERLGYPVWAKVLITSGLYTPIYYVLFFFGLEVLALGPAAALSPARLRGLPGRIWRQLKPVWRVDFWYFLIADSASFYGGPWFVAWMGLPAHWTNEVVFVIFCGFDFCWDVLLVRALHRSDGILDERQVYLEARRAASQLLRALRRRRLRRRQP